MAAADQPPDGILLPKVRGVEEILSAIDAVGHHADLKLHIQMETNEALEHAMDMARAHGLVASLVFGGFDMAAAVMGQSRRLPACLWCSACAARCHG